VNTDVLTFSLKKNVVFIPPSEGMTVFLPYFFERKNAGQKIEETELYDLISQSIWRLFDEQRISLGRRFDISELDVILADARVLSVKLDGSKVINPLGFSAKTIEIYLSATLMKRMKEDATRPGFSKNENILIVESNAAYARQLQDEKKVKKFIMAAVEEEAAYFYLIESSGKIVYLDDFNWGESHLIRDTIKSFAVSESGAKEILDRYFSGQTSLYFFKKFKPHLSRFLEELIHGIEAVIYNNKMNKTPVYVSGRLINRIEKNHWQAKAGRPIVYFVPSSDKKILADRESESLLKHKELNRFIKQRIRWLMPSIVK